ncbi:MAG: endonuclease/exonuclease/phosphatase family protein [Myxococcales bacterium]|nr:endonuclease/exonuclease/phosphatase family protein [Myxococcales bacterium]
MLTAALIMCAVLVAVGTGFLWAARGFDAAATAPEPEPAPSPSTNSESAPRAVGPGSGFRLISWNIAYGRGPEDDVGKPRKEHEIRGYLDKIAKHLREVDADVVAFQEIDFGSRRSFFIDQFDYFRAELGYRYAARITTWKKNYVPYPGLNPRRHIGRVHNGQAVLSRFPIRSNERLVLPQPTNFPWWYNAFYLNRSLQFVTIDLGVDLTLVNTHLEAFDTENRAHQSGLLVSALTSRPAAEWIVVGDMNALPPEATKKDAFEDEPGWDGSNDPTIEVLRVGLDVQETPGGSPDDGDLHFTFPATAPSRRLDYGFVSNSFDIVSARVDRSAGAVSDHLPIVLEVVLKA